MTTDVIGHYDKLIDENNDPVFDPKPLQDYMNKWDGAAFIEQMQLNSCKSVLEIGVGTGRLAIRVAPLCKDFLGIDISPKTVERAKENLAAYSNVKLICVDFLSYKFDNSFDVIYSSLTFMHIEDKQAAIDKIAKLLNHNGRFVLSIDKNPSEYIDTGTRKVKIYPDSAEVITNCLKNAGLNIINQHDTEFATIFVAKKNADITCFCGHNCSKCVTYIATQKNDNNLRKQSQDFYKENFGLDIPLEKFICEGGRSNNKFELCIDCPFIKCCKKHGVDSCYECSQYPCKEIADYQEKYVNKCIQI